MNVLNCRICGNVFRPLENEKMCSSCLDEKKQSYNFVKEYIFDNPGTTILDLSRIVRENELPLTTRELLDYVSGGSITLMETSYGK